MPPSDPATGCESLDSYTAGPNVHGSARSPASRSVRSASSSVTVTVLVFVSALALVRFIVPALVEELHYSMERGKQRAQFESAEKLLDGQPLAQLSQSSQLVSQRIAPSVVHIDTTRKPGVTLPKDESYFRFGEAKGREVLGQGSGVIIEETGEILTNHHVIRGAERIFVTLSDDRRVRATVIGVDSQTDLAVLKINADGLIPATWGDSDALREGALVWAAGSPFGLSKTITFGILSAKDRRSDDQGIEFLQSDVAVSPGNSGGPLVNSQGHVVGINTAIIGPSVSLAIPSSTARDVYERMRTGDYVQQGWLGVRLASISAQQVPRLGTPQGAFIAEFFDEHSSPARRAGIERGDVITRWDGRTVDSPQTLTNLVARTEVDAHVQVEIVRHGDKQTLQVEVGERPLQLF